MEMVDEKIDNGIKMYLHCGPFARPCGCAGAMRCASPNAACPGLHWKPLDTSIGQLLTLYCPGSRGATVNKTTMIKCTIFAGHLDGHGGAPVQYRNNPSMEEVKLG